MLSFDSSADQGFELEVDGERLQFGRGDLAFLKPRYTGNYSFVMKPQKSMALVFWVSGPRDLKQGLF